MKSLLSALVLALALSCPALAGDEDWSRHAFSHFSLDVAPGWKIVDQGETVILTDADVKAQLIVVSHEVDADMKAEDGASLFCRVLSGDNLVRHDESTYTFCFYDGGLYRSLFTVQNGRCYWISHRSYQKRHAEILSRMVDSLRCSPASAAN